MFSHKYKHHQNMKLKKAHDMMIHFSPKKQNSPTTQHVNLLIYIYIYIYENKGYELCILKPWYHIIYLFIYFVRTLNMFIFFIVAPGKFMCARTYYKESSNPSNLCPFLYTAIKYLG
jgi:hypothetical protein